MNKLLIIADDLTGALDTGVCFASAGISTCVRLPGNANQHMPNEDYSVDVAIVESRHMQAAEAYEAVHETIRRMAGNRYTYVYKKTDSALRGNIGAELAATLDATKEKTLHFIPAFPKMNRVVRQGVLYIDGVTPVAQSVFATDPFNPVKHSAILELIAEQTERNAYIAAETEEEFDEGIAVYNAETDEDFIRIGQTLIRTIGARLFAGCAGFANALPQLIAFDTCSEVVPLPAGKLAVFCGSVNPISLQQCDAAEQTGYPRYHLQRAGEFLDREEITSRISAASQRHEIVVLDTGAEDLGATDDEVLARSAVVADYFSRVIADFLAMNPKVTLFIIGGDTLLAFARNLGIHAILPVRELLPGVVLSRYSYGGEWRFLITKSGGFGAKGLFYELYQELNIPADNNRG
jgi:uncharacterized protein YgbK (DUF1537 family)